MAKDKSYTEEEVKKIIEYACGYQKAHDYQTAGHHLIIDELQDDDITPLLDELANTDSNVVSDGKLTLEEIVESISETDEEDDFLGYCPICTSCGEDGCCSPVMCSQDPKGHYCNSNLEKLKIFYLSFEMATNYFYNNRHEIVAANDVSFFLDVLDSLNTDRLAPEEYRDKFADSIRDLNRTTNLYDNIYYPQFTKQVVENTLILYYFLKESDVNFIFDIAYYPENGSMVLTFNRKDLDAYCKVIVTEDSYDALYELGSKVRDYQFIKEVNNMSLFNIASQYNEEFKFI